MKASYYSFTFKNKKNIIPLLLSFSLTFIVIEILHFADTSQWFNANEVISGVILTVLIGLFVLRLYNPKESQNKVDEIETYYKRLFEINLNPMWIFDIDTLQFLEVNPAAIKHLGYSREEFMNMTLKDIKPPEDIPDMLNKMYSDNNDLLKRIDNRRLLKKDGTIIITEIIAHRIQPKGGRQRRLVTAIDLTERNMAERAIKVLSEHRKTLLQVTQSILSSLNVEMVVQNIFSSLKQVLHFNSCGLYYLDDDNTFLKPFALLGENSLSKELQQFKVPYGKGIISSVLASGNCELINNAHLDSRSVYPEGVVMPCEHLICIPVGSKGKTPQGVFIINRTSDPGFTAGEFELAQLFAGHAAIAVENARLFQSLEQELDENKTLLREVHHRVKNNLQIVSSLIKFQIAHITDPLAKDCLVTCQNRVDAMADVHKHLYRADSLTNIDFGAYVTDFTNHLLTSYNYRNNGIAIHINAPHIYFGIETAIPCGLIINELVSNSLKHAFPEYHGTIGIGIQKINDIEFSLTVKDDGRGLPEEIGFDNVASLGMQLVKTLTDQLDGTIEITRNSGTEYKLSLIEADHKKRI